MPPSDSSLVRPILASLLARATLNTAFRLVYPFLPIIARGLGVPLEVAASLVALRAAMGFASLAVGPLADRLRRRTLILFAIGLFTIGAAGAALFSVYALFAVGFIAMGLAKIILDPTTVAYISDRVPYALRGRVNGLFEIPWATASLVGAPVAGWAIARYGWQAPYAGLAVLGGVSLLVALWGFPRADVRPYPPYGRRWWSGFGLALSQPSVRWMWLTTLCLVLANDTVFIVASGAWLEREFGLGAAALGSVAIATGLAELAGEGLSSAILDRVGKKRGILGGLIALVVAFPLLPLLGALGLGGAIVGLALLLFLFEFAYISCIPLVSELAPQARATTLSINVTASQTGRVVGSLLGPLLWQGAGLGASVAVAAGMTLLAAAFLAAKVKERQGS